MKKLLIAYHSQTGNNEQLAELACQFALDSGAEIKVELRHVLAVQADDFLAYNAFIFICPENFGSLSGLMKDLFDRTYLAVHEQTGGKPYAIVIGCDNDGRGALAQFHKILTGYRMVEATESVIVRGQLTANLRQQLKTQAEYMAQALEAGII